MIQDVKLGTHRIGIICMPSVGVCSCSAFVWKISSKNLLFLEETRQKVKYCGCGLLVEVQPIKAAISLISLGNGTADFSRTPG